METLLAAVRFGHFVSAMFVFGSGVFLVGFTPRALRVSLSPRVRRQAIVAAFVAFLTALAWLAVETAAMNDDYAQGLNLEAIRVVLGTTEFGAVWPWRIVLAAATLVALIITPVERWRIGTLLAGLGLASLALVDHGAMQTGDAGWAHRANDAAHLLATGGWLGGLPPFLMCLTSAANGPNRDEANVAMMRFSAVGHFAVLMILATGVFNVAMTTQTLPWPPSSPYRALLLTKIGAVFVMLALAGFNRYALLPSVGTDPRSGRLLRSFARGEFALALLVVALVSYFGLLDPA